MKMNIPGFTAEASLGHVAIVRPRGSNQGTLATSGVRPALVNSGGGGSGGYYCSPDDFSCVDCNDDIENSLCEECQAGGDLQCCEDPDDCTVNPRPTINCGDPSNALCLECATQWSPGVFPCCTAPACNVIPAPALPPHCFQLKGRLFCSLGPPTIFSGLGSVARL